MNFVALVVKFVICHAGEGYFFFLAHKTYLTWPVTRKCEFSLDLFIQLLHCYIYFIGVSCCLILHILLIWQQLLTPWREESRQKIRRGNRWVGDEGAHLRCMSWTIYLVTQEYCTRTTGTRILVQVNLALFRGNSTVWEEGNRSRTWIHRDHISERVLGHCCMLAS